MENTISDLVLKKMSYEEAVAFAGIYGMNAIVLNQKTNRMQMVRLYNNPTDKLPFGAYDIETFKTGYDIYWIGSYKY